MMSDPRRRVKLYILEDGLKWIDKGTGQISLLEYTDENSLNTFSQAPKIMVDSEASAEEILLQRTLRSFEHYCQQEGTLIVWTEATGEDLAVSFQEPEGCAEFWELIKEACNKMAHDDGGDENLDSPFIQEPFLPEPTIENLQCIASKITCFARFSFGRQRLSTFLISSSYIAKLSELFELLEDLEALDKLSLLFLIVKGIVFLGDHDVYASLVSDEHLFSTLGMLEYDDSCKDLQWMFRNFFKRDVRYVKVVDCMPSEFHSTITLIFRLQYLRDVVMARYLNDHAYSHLSENINNLYQDIFSMLLVNNSFIREIQKIFGVKQSDPMPQSSSSTPPILSSNKIDSSLPILCSVSKNEISIEENPILEKKSDKIETIELTPVDSKPIPNDGAGSLQINDYLGKDIEITSKKSEDIEKESNKNQFIGPIQSAESNELNTTEKEGILEKRRAAFFLKDLAGSAKQCRDLSSVEIFSGFFRLGLFTVLESAIQDSDLETRQAISEFLGVIVEVDRKLVQQHCLESQMLQSLIGQLLRESDEGLLHQWVEILKILLELESLSIGESFFAIEAGSWVQRPVITAQYESFQDLFYQCAPSKILEPLRQVLLQKSETRIVDLLIVKRKITVYKLPSILVCQVYQIMELLVLMLKTSSTRFKTHILNVEEFHSAFRILAVSVHKHLQLTCIRIAKILVKIGEEAFLVENGLVVPLLQALALTEGKSNLVNSAILDFLDLLGQRFSRIVIKQMTKERSFWDKIDYAKHIFARFSTEEMREDESSILSDECSTDFQEEIGETTPVQQKSLVGYSDDELDEDKREEEKLRNEILVKKSQFSNFIKEEVVDLTAGKEINNSAKNRIAIGMAYLRRAGVERKIAESETDDSIMRLKMQTTENNRDIKVNGGSASSNERDGVDILFTPNAIVSNVLPESDMPPASKGNLWNIGKLISSDRKKQLGAAIRRRGLLFGNNSKKAEQPVKNPQSLIILENVITSVSKDQKSPAGPSCASVCDSVLVEAGNELPSKRLKVDGINENHLMTQSR